MKKTVFIVVLVAIVAMAIVGCGSDADVASYNVSREADMFRVYRRIVFYNGITDNYILVVEGYCSLGNADPADELSVICKVEGDQYVKHFLGLSDNVTYFAEQIEPKHVSDQRYKVFFKPKSIVPDVELSK
jgi:hypothetical protein